MQARLLNFKQASLSFYKKVAHFTLQIHKNSVSFRGKSKEEKMKIKPLFDRVVLSTKEREKETKNGIILPSLAEEKSQIATVVAVGEGGLPDGKEMKMKVKVGDTVLFAKYSGTEIEDDGKKYIIVRQADILAILE